MFAYFPGRTVKTFLIVIENMIDNYQNVIYLVS